jgi:hypothetical protein
MVAHPRAGWYKRNDPTPPAICEALVAELSGTRTGAVRFDPPLKYASEAVLDSGR